MKRTEHNFTIYNDQVINKRVKDDLDRIQERLLSEFGDNIVSLILAGGFGRGEGGVIIKNGEIIPVNDYDIVIVVDSPVKDSAVKNIEKRLAKEVGITWVDIDVFQVSKLKRLRFTQYHYDIKYSGHIFYGNDDVLSYIPEMKAEDMPLIEGEKLFFTRLWSFLGGYSPEFNKRKMTNEESFFLSNQLSKSLLACLDSRLFLKKQYHVSYSARLERCKKLFPMEEDFLQLMKWAAMFKLKPTTKTDANLIDFYFEVKEFYLREMRGFLEIVYGTKFKNWNAFEKLYFFSWRNLFKRIGYVIVKRSFWYEKFLRITLAQLFLVAAYDKDRIDSTLFELAKKYINVRTGINCSPKDWDYVKNLSIQLREEIW